MSCTLVITLSACLAISFSIIFRGWLRREIGLQDLWTFYVSLPGFGIHIIFDLVHWVGVH